MFFNIILSKLQKNFNSIYNRSFLLQKIDWLIGLNILFVVLASLFMSSDSIGNFALSAIILTFIKLITKPNEKFEFNFADIFLLIYFMVILISVAGSSLFELSCKGFLKTIIYLGFYISTIFYFKDNKDKIKYLFITLAFCVSFESIIALLQNYVSVAEISGWQDTSRLNPEEIMTRVYGTLKPYNPNLFGGYLLATLPSFIALPFISKENTGWTIIGGLLGIVALVLTGCRGAYIGLFFQIIILLSIIYKFIKPQLQKSFLAIVGFFVMIMSLIIISISSLKARVFSIFAMRKDSSNSFRFNVYNSCVEMFKDNWLLGIGCGNQNFREIYGLYMKTGFDALSAYNIYLEIAVESGIFALIAFVTFIITTLKSSLKFIFNKNNLEEKSFVIAAIISLFGILIHGFVDTVFFRPQIQFTFWAMLGVIRVLVK